MLNNARTNTRPCRTHGARKRPHRRSVSKGNRSLPIRPNLEKALYHLRLPGQARRLWIDAICIDQTNTNERSRQVQYMNKVYKHAARVVVWLGAKSPGIELAFEVIKRMARVQEMLDEDSASRQGQLSIVDQETSSELMAAALNDLPEDAMQHLVDLFDRPYLGRSWCVQEVVVCSWAIARCEELEVPFLDLIATAQLVLQLHNLQGNVLPDNPCQFWNMVHMRKRRNAQISSKVEGSMGSLLNLLMGTREFKATDPRDKIFSLFGICDEGIQPVLAMTQVMSGNGKDPTVLKFLRKAVTSLTDHVNNVNPALEFGRPAALKPDYNKSVVRVYSDVTRFQMRSPPRLLEVLDHVQHKTDPTGGEFPSWVPKWFEPKSCSTMAAGCFLAGLCEGHFRYFAELHDSPLRGDSVRPLVLSLDGYRVDIVQTVSDPVNFGVSDSVPIQQIWAQIFPFSFFRPHAHLYRTGESLDVELCKTMMVAPLGSAFTIIFQQMNANQDLGPPPNVKETMNRQADADVAHFITNFAQQNEASAEDYQSLVARAYQGDMRRFSLAAHSLSYNRRLFMTTDGRLGLGPMVMQPGDEVVVLFGGRMPFIVRPKPDHHVFIGDCYVRDDDVMWGDMTERVRYNRGGPPVFTFELR